MKMTTCCYIRNKDGEVLMLHRNKKEIDINKGKWVGIGGKMENGESPFECVIREVKEETGLTLLDPHMAAMVTFNFLNPEPELQDWETEYMFVFTCDVYDGVVESEDSPEGQLLWVPVDAVSGLDLWEGDALFMDPIFQGAPFFTMKIVYQGDEVVNWSLDL